MKHINLTNWHGSLTDWTKLNYIYGGLDDTYAVKGNLRIDNDNYNYVELRESKNLIQLNDVEETTTNGITWKIQNGTIYLNGTASAYFSINLLEYCQVTSNVMVNFFDIQGTSSKSSIIRVNNTYQAPTTTGTYYSSITNFVLYTDYSYSFTNYQIKPMLVIGSTAPTIYEPYFEGKKPVITETLGIVDLGTLNWEDNIANYGFKTTSALSPNAFVDNDTKLFNGVVIPKKYTIVNPNSATLYAEDNWIAIGQNNQIIYCKDTTYASAVEFKAGMSGVMLIYQLKDPIIEVVE